MCGRVHEIAVFRTVRDWRRECDTALYNACGGVDVVVCNVFELRGSHAVAGLVYDRVLLLLGVMKMVARGRVHLMVM